MVGSIMQPYFLPYLGYFQLINEVDIFILYDNIEYTKKGWINRNRYLNEGKDKYFTLPLKKDSDYLNINKRYISNQFDKKKLLNQIDYAYKKAPFFLETFHLIDKIIAYQENNLFEYIFYSLNEILKYLEIKTEVVKSSLIEIDHSLKCEKKVLAICKKLNIDTYVNPIGGIALYENEIFETEGIELKLMMMKEDIFYKQFGESFVSSLSIIDVLMFNGKNKTKELLTEYEIIKR